MISEADKAQDAGAEPLSMATVLNDRFCVEPGKRLPSFSGPSNDACEVSDSGPGGSAFAILCRKDVPWRDRQLRALADTPCHGVIKVLASGPVDVSPDGGRRFAIVMEKPVGEPFATPTKDKHVEPFTEKTLTGRILPQIHKALTELSRRNMAHRAIRPDNIFYDEENGTVTLGDSVSVPPGRDQPIAYEPIERALAARDGRGVGDTACDLFALGATVVALVTGRDPAMGRSDEDQITARLSLGSFRAYGCENKLFSVHLMALLRGLLCDDPAYRWTLGLVGAWLEKSGGLTRPPLGSRSGTHPFTFGDKIYSQPALLARALAADPQEAIKALKGPGIEPWLANSMRDEMGGQKLRALREKVNAASGSASRAANIDLDEIVSQMCRAIDPRGPVYYRGIVAQEDGVATLLATAFAAEDRKTLSAFGDLFRSGLLRNLVRPQGDEESMVFKDPFQKPMRWSRDVRPGGGLERCLYGMSPALPCQSPLVTDSCVGDLRDLVTELERIATKLGPEVNPVDRHVAAFIADRSRELGTAVVQVMEEKASRSGQRFAPVLVLALLQKRRNGLPLPALAKWARLRIMPMIDSLHRRSRREAISKLLDEAVKEGNIQAIVEAFGFPKVIPTDEREFTMAKERAGKLRVALKFLRSPAALKQSVIIGNSHRIAFLVSYASLVACAFWVFYVYMRNVL